MIKDPIPENPVVGLMDVIDETEELFYIDDGTPMEITDNNPLVSMLEGAIFNPSPNDGQGAGSKESDPIKLGETEIEKPEENPSQSPPPTFEEAEQKVKESAGGDSALGSKGDDTLLLEHTGTFLPVALSLSL